MTELSTRIVARYRQAKLEAGRSREHGNLRVSRLMDALFLFDLTNAGKRGKTVERVVVRPTGNLSHSETQQFLDRLSIMLEGYGTLISALGSIKDYLHDFPDDLELKSSNLRGVDVTPAGFEEIQMETHNLRLQVELDSFSITDRIDRNNERTCIPAAKGGKKDLPVFYRWVRDNESEVRRMTYSDMLGKLKELGVTYRTYCALD